MVAQGFPVVAGVIDRALRCEGEGKSNWFPLGNLFQSCVSVFPNSVAVLMPDNETLSKTFENFSIARTPQAFATVVSHRPCFCRPRAPRVSLGTSCFQAVCSSRDKTSRTALVSLETINHQRKSEFSVEKPIIVPWK